MICQVCHKEYNKEIIDNFFGKDHLVSRLNMCSTKCYIERNNKPNNMFVTIYGGNQGRKDSKEYLETIELAKKLASKGYIIKTGGYYGIMEAASIGATSVGGEAIGYTCADFPSVKGNDFLTQNIICENIFQRLEFLIKNTDLFIVQRGSVGTLSELFLTLDIVRKMDNKPRIILIGEFWESIIVSLDYLVSAKDLSLMTLVYNINQIEI